MEVVGTIAVPFLPPAEAAYPRHSIFEDSYCFRANFPFPSFGGGHSLLKGVVASRSPANPRFFFASMIYWAWRKGLFFRLFSPLPWRMLLPLWSFPLLFYVFGIFSDPWREGRGRGGIVHYFAHTSSLSCHFCYDEGISCKMTMTEERGIRECGIRQFLLQADTADSRKNFFRLSYTTFANKN